MECNHGQTKLTVNCGQISNYREIIQNERGHQFYLWHLAKISRYSAQLMCNVNRKNVFRLGQRSDNLSQYPFLLQKYW